MVQKMPSNLVRPQEDWFRVEVDLMPISKSELSQNLSKYLNIKYILVAQ